MAGQKDLRYFLDELKDKCPEDWVELHGPVDPHLEISAVAQKHAERGHFPALFFHKVKGSALPVVNNIHADRKKMALALGTTEEGLTEEYIRRAKNPIPPLLAHEAPVKEVIMKGEEVDLTRLPIPTHSKKDAGPYITAGIAVMKDPDTAALNMGIYRHMLQGKAQLGVWLNPLFHGGDLLRRAEKRGVPLEIAIVIGAHPAFAIASQNTEPLGSDDYALAGGLMGQPLRVIKGEFVSFPVPAYAEIVIEGLIPPHVRQDEGPFAEYPTYYGMRRQSPLVQVKAISHRKDAIFQDLNSAQQEHLCLWIVPAKEAGLFSKVKAVFPTLKAVRIPFSGAGFHAYIAIEKVRDGDGKNVILAAMGSEPIVKHVVAVDNDIDIRCDSEVLWAIATRVQADKDIFIIPGSRTTPLDPSSYGLTQPYSGEGMVTKMGIDATKPLGIAFAERTRP